MSQDILYALRSLRRSPGFALVAILTLAFGIAANTLVFSVINAVMLHPLPYASPERLVTLQWYGHSGLLSPDVSAPAFFMLQDQTRSFESIAAVYNSDIGVNLTALGVPRYAKALKVSARFFETLGVNPALGRSFHKEDNLPNAPGTVVLSYGLWANAFGKRDSAIGTGLRVNGQVYTVIGVVPAEFHSYPEAELWLPLQFSSATSEPGNEYEIIARLKQGVGRQDVQRDLDSLPDLRSTFPLRSLSSEARLVADSWDTSITSNVRQGLVLLFGAVIFVLLITCTNLAMLLTVRASARTRETAIRAALGAGNARLLRIFLIESSILSILGGTLGAIVGKEMIPFVLWLKPSEIPLRRPIALDGTVALFVTGVAVLSALVFAALPAAKMRVAQSKLGELLRQPDNSVGTRQGRTGRILVAMQSALTILLLAGASLLLYNFLALQSVPPGFDPHGVLVAQVSLASRSYEEHQGTVHLLERLSQRLRSVPGVQGVGSITGLPFERGLNLLMYPAGAHDAQAFEHFRVEYRIVGTGYFETMHIPVVAGSSFSSKDNSQTEPVAIINETLARLWWPHEIPVGHSAVLSQTRGGSLSDAPRRIVGIVADVREFGPMQPPQPTIFVPFAQAPDDIIAFVNKAFLTSIIIRTNEPGKVSEALMASVEDPDLPIASLRPLDRVIHLSLARPRFYTTLIVGFGGFALLLTAIGLYALLSYQIALRSREIGIRVAVGARRSAVVGAIAKHGIIPVSIGIMLGLAGVPLIAHLLRALLYNLKGMPVGAPIAAAVVLGTVAVMTSLLTAARATTIDPVMVLRTE